MSEASTSIEVDAIVIGGGPAGATAAATLARLGRSVAVLERARFPRYHIGESLLPCGWWTLQRIGALEVVREAGFQVKQSVRFVTPDGRMSAPFTFSDHVEHPSSATWQVDRATFDHALLRHAADAGALVLEETSVTGLIEDDGAVIGVVAKSPDGPVSVRAPVTIDASGRDGVVRSLRGWRRAEPALQRVALWTYVEGFPRDEGTHAGATTVVSLPEDGWFWVIPMANGRTSVGVVRHPGLLYGADRDIDAAFARAVTLNPWLAERMAGCTAVDGVHVTSDYSYRSEHCADDGVVLAGDAFAFLDPVFSSGVFLALRTGEEAALAAHRALQAGDVTAAAFAGYGRWACAGLEAMRALVFSFYDREFSMAKLMRAHPELKGDVTDLLIGDFFRDHAALLGALDEVGTVPAVLPYGGARVVGSTA